MKLILDTHVLLWYEGAQLRLKDRALLQDPANDVLISVVSIWEIAIKISVRKIRLVMSDFMKAVEASGFVPLALTFQHAVEYSNLPLHGRDPFDRMLIAQSISENAYLLTSDTALKAYGDVVRLL